MVKYILIILNALVVLIYGWFSSDGSITVSGNFPKSMKPGTEVVVELTVKKGSLGGFAKLQLELPEGVTVKEIDNKGASFTAGPGLAKWIWTSLPSDAEMIVKFNLVADASSNGTKTIGGKFSYIENNAKQVSEMTPVEVVLSVDAVTPVANTESTPTPTSSTTEPSTSTPTTVTEPITSVPNNSNSTNTVVKTPTNNIGRNNTIANSSATTTTTEPKTSPNGEPIGNVNGTRKVTQINANQFQVDIKIKKDGTKGFARFSDNLPEGFTAKQVKTDGSSFSVADGKIKFVWVTVPAVDELNISYTLNGSNTKATTLMGEYSYLEDNQSKKIKLNNSDLPATPEAVTTNSEATATKTITEKPSDNSSTANTTKTESTTKTPDNTASTSTDKNASTTTTENPPTNKTESTLTENLNKKEGTVNYAVQVGAFTNGNVTANLLANKFKIKEKIRSEMASGFNKFMVGNFGEYKTARDHRETVKSNNGIASAFVVAYNGGRRITVQEALTVTNQKWFK
jgi:hypothetical protein